LHVLYALCGTGRGHASRALALAHLLRERGHRVTLASGGPNLRLLHRLGEPTLTVPALRQVFDGNGVDLRATARANWRWTYLSVYLFRRLERRLHDLGADGVVCDFEPFLPYVARRMGLPVVALNHQQILSAARCRVPFGHRLSALGTAAGIAFLAPSRPARVVVPTFFFPPVRDPRRTVLVPPILRPEVLQAHPTRSGDLLVYYNAPDPGALDALHAAGLSATVYGFPEPADAARRYPRLHFRAPSQRGFLRDLARCRAVVATAGFTLMSEALHLGKPVLAVPNRGFFEQLLNALELERSGRGMAVPSGRLTAADLRRFDEQVEAGAFDAALTRPVGVGNAQAVREVERGLGARSAPVLRPGPPVPTRRRPLLSPFS
jgi:uncharacterized protein (TIGR00661 family)